MQKRETISKDKFSEKGKMMKNKYPASKFRIQVVLVFILILNACNLPSGKTAPEITSVAVENNCNIRINYIDHVKDANAVVFLKRQVGNASSDQIKATNPHGEQAAGFLDEGLPSGVYSYRIGYFDSDATYYGDDHSAPVTLDANCGTAPLVDMPFNPIIIRVGVGGIGGCAVQITAKVFGSRTDGVRIYRSESGAEYMEIDNLSLDEWAGGPYNGYMYSTNAYSDFLPSGGAYRYKMSAYNANGESFSEPSEEVIVPETACSPVLESVPTVASMVVVTSTPTTLPAPKPEACIWEAAVNVFVRKGPGASLYSDITGVVAGTQFPVVGQSEDGQFWVVEVKPGLNGYVPKAEKYSRTKGDCGNSPIVQDPPLPPTVTPVVIPQCNDGIDNDGDGSVDMRDRQCLSLDDNSEN